MSDDSFAGPDNVSYPARKMWLITPHATNALPLIPKAIRANDAGDVVLRAVDSDADVTVTMAAGEQLPIRAEYIRVTGTTVTVLHGMG